VSSQEPSRSPDLTGGLAWFNALTAGRAEAVLLSCCAAPGWAATVAAGRPYREAAEVYAAAHAAFDHLVPGDLDLALVAHPRIGERAQGTSREAAWSRQEQNGVADADAALHRELVEANLAYEQRFGHVFLIRASGRSAAQMLAACRRRLANDSETERGEVLEQLRAITRLRLERLVEQVP
jgi:2-oxo-4-hydroxy-4-carboxy-5-ureidoimidazoline decarboxylase